MSKRAKRILAEIREIRLSASGFGLTLGNCINANILERIAEVAAKVK